MIPNLMVEDMPASINFYKEHLGFEKFMSVPEEQSKSEFDWAWIKNGDVNVMLQTRESIEEDMDIFKGVPLGASLGFYTKVPDVQGLYDRLKGKVEIVMDMRTTFYGAKEFGITDNSGYHLTFAQEM